MLLLFVLMLLLFVGFFLDMVLSAPHPGKADKTSYSEDPVDDTDALSDIEKVDVVDETDTLSDIDDSEVREIVGVNILHLISYCASELVRRVV